MTDHSAREALRRIKSLSTLAVPDARDLQGYSLRRALNNLGHEQRSGLEFEISRDLERSQPAVHGGLIVPFGVFTRADNVGSLSQGGYLVETANVPAADALRPNMVVGPLGATIINAPYGANVNLPRLTGVATASWMSTESTTISETNQTVGQVGFSPRTVGAYTEISRLLLLQAGPSPSEIVVRQDLIAVLARALDYAALFGTGVAGQPRGIANTNGISTFSGTSLSLTSIVDAAVALGDALDDSAGVAASRTTAGLLKTRPESSGSTRLLWEGSLVAGTSVGFPARSSSQITSGSYFLGSWRYLNIVVWGGGMEVAMNPYGSSTTGGGSDANNFKQGIVGIRAFLTADVAPTFASAFNYASTVT